MYMQNVCISVYMTACLGVYVCVYMKRARERERKQTIPVRVSFLVYPLDYSFCFIFNYKEATSGRN